MKVEIGSQILGDFRQMRGDDPLIGACAVPVVDLQTEKHAEDNDHGFDKNREPVLTAESGGDAAQDHC